MILSANYAASPYGSIAYGARGQANYASATSDAVTGADALAAIAACVSSTAEAVTGSDSISAIAAFYPGFAESVTGSDLLALILYASDQIRSLITAADFGASYIFHPADVFDAQEYRMFNVPAEKRAGTAELHAPVSVNAENRQAAANPENRNFKA